MDSQTPAVFHPGESVADGPHSAVDQALARPFSSADRTAVLDALPMPIWCLQLPDGTEYFNAAWQSRMALHISDRGDGWLQAVHPSDRVFIRQQWALARQSESALEFESRLLGQDGEYRWYQIRVHLQPQELPGLPACWLGLCTDIHERIHRERALQADSRARGDMLDASMDCIKLIDTRGLLSHMNRAGCVALGVPEDSGFGMKWLELLPAEIRSDAQRALDAACIGKNARFAGKSQLPGLKPQYWDNLLTPLVDEHGATQRILCVSREVTLQHEIEERLRIASERDALTGLLNRRAFRQAFKKQFARARKSHAPLGLLLIDLDYFKQVNDSLGHPAGDHLLRVLARRLSAQFNGTGQVARLGGDEFAVLLPDITDDAALERAAHQIQLRCKAPVTYAGRQINGGLSIGGALFPRDANDIPALMKCADTALNTLKNGGRGGVRIHDEAMRNAAQAAAARMSLARSIAQGPTIEPMYRPRVSLADRRTLSLEALLHWRCAHTGQHSASSIAEAFNDYSLAMQLGERLQERVFTDLAAWQARNTPCPSIVLPVVSAEFMRDDYAERLIRRLERFGIPASRIELQITERDFFERGSEFVLRALGRLRALGMRVCIDGFGTSHCALTGLADLPIDGLRINAALVERMLSDTSAHAVIRAIGVLGSGLSLQVVANGISHETQCTALLQAGFCTGQGPLFGALHPAGEI